MKTLYFETTSDVSEVGRVIVQGKDNLGFEFYAKKPTEEVGAVCHCNRKENAELIAKILDYDVDNEVCPLVTVQEPFWHTEEPTEEGEYLCISKIITWNSKEVTESQIVYWCDEFYINGFPIDRTSILAWHKIPRYEEKV